jgi:hypothetical protein
LPKTSGFASISRLDAMLNGCTEIASGSRENKNRESMTSSHRRCLACRSLLR